MSYTGRVEGGVIRLPPGINWPEGTPVLVERVESAEQRLARSKRIRELTTQMPEMPSDWALQHDHYIHGTPKRSV